MTRPIWQQQSNEGWTEWHKRMEAEKMAAGAKALAHLRANPMKPVAGPCAIAVGVGTFDGNGNEKGAGWW